MMNAKRLFTNGLLAALFALFAVTGVSAAPGDAIYNVTVPVPSASCCGIGVAVGCNGTIFYTNTYDPTLHSMDVTGAPLGSLPIVDAAGNPVSIGAIAWDNTRQMLWGGTDSRNPAAVYLIDPLTGMATYQFDVVNAPIGFIDGIAFDASDNTVWVSDDVHDIIDHYDAATSTFIGAVTPLDPAGNVLGRISGVTVGTGNTLYVGRNGEGEIVRIDKTTGAYISGFATIGGRDEDLECDVINFAPLTVLWSKDAYDNTLTAIEVEPGTCACGGGAPEITQIDLDIKPQSCPNPLNVKENELLSPASAGETVVPVAILGSDMFDVHHIDPATIMFAGLEPLRWEYEDVATPVMDNPDEDCECTTEGADGFMDMTLKFSKAELIATLDSVANGDYITLTITGMTYDGEEFAGSDCMLIRLSKGGKGGTQASAEVRKATLEPAVLATSNYPNPFNAATLIHYELSDAGHVNVGVYNILGQNVKTLVDGERGAGSHSETWDGTNSAGQSVASGMYFYRVRVGNDVVTRKMTLLK